ncbi:MAG: helix-turn-helix transcriptional regulator [Eggerthellaceae bacterium]|jgi:transcriptional regulator with XRE-family HTH domain|nr:helix-turn-helix transcriptional regulator [Eggerthellaceae bacterium]MDR2721892.1 helix-turn-helix transcriptional regulator [Coriobacteriaceae bacterium]
MVKAYQIIAQRVKERGITKAELSRRIVLDDELLRRSLAGTRKITADEFIKLCHELKLTLADFEGVLPSKPGKKAKK